MEDIIMDAEFQVQQGNFMDKYYQQFKNTEENKLTYMAIFNKNLSFIEKYIENQLLERIPGYNMAIFTATLKHHNDEAVHDIVNMLTFTDFLAFKEMFPQYRAEKEGRRLYLCSGLAVTSLCKLASQNNTQQYLLRPGSGSLIS
ncbi:ADP-ribosylation factor-like protein 2-binding protein [Budorcas taxicolor]|uniref:ADP-ribosylation factor-like protein 2-binding protein n=1 Tax=Budorcas taxicolor TaxID=37181 RepID=UPI00228515A2|nr:ADP-ribosylation factor-like protein 2-binding protein [Budorcas taxicolor]